MAFGVDPGLTGWLILGGFVVAIAALLLWRFLMGRRIPGYLAIAEYWVYCPETKIPPIEKVMDRMINGNPHNRPGKPCIGAREGMLFSDIRLHMGLATRAKNSYLFRPDLVESDVVPTPEILDRLPECQVLIRAKYASEAKLSDLRHLQFMPHLADALADLAGGLCIYDHVTDELFTKEEFAARLEQNNNAERPNIHIRVLWRETASGGIVETRGLRKVGHREWRIGEFERDQEVLATAVVMRAAHRLFRDPALAGPYEVEEFEDVFVLTPTGTEEGFTRLDVVRRQVR